MRFKLFFPTGCEVADVLDGNFDVNVITEKGNVYFMTIFTVKNVVSIMKRNKDKWFWSTDMLIVEDLEMGTVLACISEIISLGYLGSIGTKIGKIKKFKNNDLYPLLTDWRHDSLRIFSGV